MPHRSVLCRLILCAVFSVTFINFFSVTSSPSFFSRHGHHHKQETLSNDDNNELVCPQSPLANDVLIILRTGATESRHKVPVHLRTTLRCVPNFLLLSDLDEEIEGHKLHNVLGGVSAHIRNDHEDFKLYNQLQASGKAGLETPEPFTAQSGSVKGDYLNTDRPGWKLDKWKFLPAVDKAFQHRPQAKWYVFIETDTYFVWPNLLSYLSHFDASQPHYIGKHLYINSIEFGYGGAGFILSNPAVRKGREQRSVRIREYEDFTASHWVGDCAVGKVMQDVGVPLFKAWPHLQGDAPVTLDPNTTKIGRGVWCFPVVTFHHVSPGEIEELWGFEQEWFGQHNVLLRHRDIFRSLLLPLIRPNPILPHWDNLSQSREYNALNHSHLYNHRERSSWRSFEDCRALCEDKPECLQFSYQEKTCRLGFEFRVGYERKGEGEGKREGEGEGMRSGWLVERVEELFLELESGCGIRDWFAPKEVKMEHGEVRKVK